MLVIIYHLLKNGTVYNKEKYEVLKEKQKLNQYKHLASNAKKQGYRLVPIENNFLVEMS